MIERIEQLLDDIAGRIDASGDDAVRNHLKDYYRDRLGIIISSEVERVVEERMSKDGVYEPYFGWCDVDGCDGEGCCGGTAWPETGYWTVCSEHSAMHRNHGKQPKMKQDAIDRENTRDKITGYLPIPPMKGDE